jgi:predicted nucleic acid-binding protein
MAIGKQIYWDTCPLIAWITDEKTRTAQEKAALDQVAEEFSKGKCIIVMSSIFRVEIIPLEKDQQEKLNLFTKRSNFQEIVPIPPILDLAGEIRRFYREKKQSISTPDAIHLATAIHTKVDVFQTFDGAGRKRGLLGLSGNVAGRNLTITTPFISQPNLPLGT